ncbi:Ig-like domain-containing protein [Pseudomonas sp.]|uniref:Ig-like domain-containing protein n=1 Tax=Pseudomonas sp. TaxID=306 RepID=UPI003D6FE89C
MNDLMSRLSGTLLCCLLSLPAWAMEPPSMGDVRAGELDLATVTGSSVMVAVPVDGSFAGRTLTLWMEPAVGTEPVYPPLPIGQNLRPRNLTVPKERFTNRPGESVKVFYEVSGLGKSPELTFKIAQGFAGEYIHDVSRSDLIMVYRDGVLQFPAQGELPAQLTFTRQAPGAHAYASSDPSIATVDNSGKVNVLRNGETTIEATSATAVQSYLLKVRGLREFDIVAKNGTTWANAHASCQDMRRRLPTANDFNDLKGRYPSRLRALELPDYPIWGVGEGASTAVTLNPRTDSVGGATTDENTLLQVACISG